MRIISRGADRICRKGGDPGGQHHQVEAEPRVLTGGGGHLGLRSAVMSAAAEHAMRTAAAGFDHNSKKSWHRIILVVDSLEIAIYQHERYDTIVHCPPAACRLRVCNGVFACSLADMHL